MSNGKYDAADLNHNELTSTHPSLSRGQVWCRECGTSHKVNAAQALKSGWPKCCGYTMTIDSPEEQKRLSCKAVNPGGNER